METRRWPQAIVSRSLLCRSQMGFFARWSTSLPQVVGKVLSSRILGANLQGIDRWSTPDSKTPSRGGTQKGKMCFLGRFGGQSGLAVLPGSRAPLIKERMSEDCPVHCWCNNTYRIHTIRTRRYMSAAPLLLDSLSNLLSCACVHICCSAAWSFGHVNL